MEVMASEFKAKCLHMMDKVAKTGEHIVITKRGEPIAELVPVTKKPKDIFGCMKGSMEIKGDIMSPIDISWNAMDKDEF